MIKFIEIDQQGFSLDEATSYLNHEVIRKAEDRTGKSIVETNGLVVGLLVMNDEIELVVQWRGEIKQYIKAEFLDQLEVVND